MKKEQWATSLLHDITFEAVRARHSVRSFTDQEISSETSSRLRAVVSDCNAEAGLHFQLVTNEPDAFGKSMLAHYGRFRNVKNYLCLVAPKGEQMDEVVGYYGEIFVLLAQTMGLNTCWVALTYSKSNTHFTLTTGEKLYAVIALGYGTTQGPAHKVKKPQQVASQWNEAPVWFRNGVECALLAPTAINQQKFHFRYEGDNKVCATTSWGPYAKIDLGIAKLHFEIGAAGHPFEWL